MCPLLRRRPENYWLYIIFLVGSSAPVPNIVAEVLPDIPLLRGAIHGFGRRSRVQTLETQIWITLSGKLRGTWRTYMERRSTGRRESPSTARCGPQRFSHTFYFRARPYSRRIIFRRPSRFGARWSKGTENLTITGRRVSWRMLPRTGDMDRSASCLGKSRNIRQRRKRFTTTQTI